MSNNRVTAYMPQSPWAQRAYSLSLFLLVAVIAVRPLVSETYDSAGDSISRAIEALADPSPARTMVFDLAILVAAGIWLIGLNLERQGSYRWTGLEPGLALLLVAAGVSCTFAGNKRLAINAAVDWLCYPLLAITLAQVVRVPWHRRILLAVILAGACVHAAQCFDQYFVSYRETLEQYQSQREEFWAKQGVGLDSSMVDSFERRLRARQASGFFAHSNVAGAYLMLCVIAGAGLVWTAVGSIRKEPAGDAGHMGLAAVIIAGCLTAVLGAAVFLTGSTGSIAAGAVGLGLLAVAWRKRDWTTANRRRLFWIAWLAVVAGAVAIFAHGVYWKSLPGWSLTFRWQYWTNSLGMIADHFWTGVGPENFGRHYTLYKDITSPEEVSNPHNFLVQFASEWGALGLIATILMLIGASWRAARSNVTLPPLSSATSDQSQRTWGWTLSIGAIVVLSRGLLLGSSDPNYVYYSVLLTALIWLPAFAGFYVAGRALKSDNIVSLALGAGLVAFLLQDLISFALFVPASATVCFVILGIWLSTRSELRSTPPSVTRFLALGSLGVVGWFAFFALGPVWRSSHELEIAKRAAAGGADASTITRAFEASHEADPIDPTPLMEWARWLSAQDDEPSIRQAIKLMDEAIVRDPFQRHFYWRKAQLLHMMAEHSMRPEDFLAAIEAARSAQKLYPQDPAGQVRLADVERIAGMALNSPELVDAAINRYRQALGLDNRRLEWETIQRFRPRMLEEIKTKISHAQNWLSRSSGR